MTEQTKALANFGDRGEIRELSERIQKMLPGGANYSASEALTLAQIAVAHDLDPFNGEVWLIKDERKDKVYGALIGIKGHRKHAKKQANYWGVGANGGFARVVDPNKIVEYGANPEDIVFEYRIMDDKTLEPYTSNLERLTTMGVPYQEAMKMFGPPPVTLGIGIYTRGEQTRMKPVQCAMFRAEKDALKRRFDVKFRIELNGGDIPVEVADFDDDPAVDEIEAEYEELNGDEPKDSDEILEELGYAQFEPSAYPGKVVNAVVMAGYSENQFAAVNAFKKMGLPTDITQEDAVTVMRLYRGHRDAGKNSDEAAELASKGVKP